MDGFGTLKEMLSETSEKFADHSARQAAEIKSLKDRILDVEQKAIKIPSAGYPAGRSSYGELSRTVVESESIKGLLAGNSSQATVHFPASLLHGEKALIVGASSTVAPDYRPGIVSAAQRRLTVRALFNELPTNSNTVDIVKESTFQNNAAPQGYLASPQTDSEGQPKAESALSFQLQTVNVSTIAHWTMASRQVLSDQPALENFVAQKLGYGLALEIERELLLGSGVQGEFSGLVTNATTFSGGSTNLSALDAIDAAIGQLIGSNYSPSGIILHPQDWHSSTILLAKASGSGQYVLGDPGAATAPSLWGVPVVLSGSMSRGSFLVLDAAAAGWIAVRETATLRVSDQTNDDFIRNVIRLLLEERLAFCLVQTGAVVLGNLSHAG